MSKKIKLADVPVGKSIVVFGKKFTVLDHTDKGILVLSESIEAEMPFLDKYTTRAALNDFCDSNIYQYLNGEYLDKLMNSAEDTDAILDMEIDLKCTLGQHEYGMCVVKAGLLTLEQYGKYFDIIPKVDDCWWLATPYVTPLYFSSDNSTNDVWFVSLDGSFYTAFCGSSHGVRPVLLLNPLLLVSCDDISGDDMSNNKTTLLSDFSDEELLEEISHRFKVIGFIGSKNEVEDDCNG